MQSSARPKCYYTTQKRLLWWWCAPVRWKSTFSKRTLRPFLVEPVPPEVNGCSLLAKIELVCLHGSMVLMCSLWLTNHRTPIWDKWTITVAAKTRCFEVVLYTKQHSHYRTTQTLLCSSKHNKLRRNVSLINDVCVLAPSVAADLLPTLSPSVTRHQTISVRIQQRWCDNTHDSVHKHVSQDAPHPQRLWKTW